jgi:rhomboid protease GluP
MDWKKFFDSLGLNGTHWQWRMIRWQNRWEDFKANLWGKKQVVTYQHKFCRECGGLLDRDETICPKCGTKAESWRKQSFSRMLGLVMPRACLATPILLVVNFAVMIVMLRLFGIPMLLMPSIEAIAAMGGFVMGKVPVEGILQREFLDGAYWQIITYGFLHFGMMHIGFNMLALSQVGPLLEDEIGTARFYSVYMITLVCAVVPHLIFPSNHPIIVAGASGALFGLIGFGVTYCHFSGGFLRHTYRGFFIKWGIYGFIFGFMIGADNVAHAGGFVTGALLGFLIERERLNRGRFTPIWKLLAAIWVVLPIAAYIWLYIESTKQL